MWNKGSTKLTSEEIQRVCSDYQAFVPRRTICDSYQIDQGTLGKYIKISGIPLRGPLLKLTPEKKRALIVDYQHGISWKNLATKYKLADATIIRVLDGHNILRRGHAGSQETSKANINATNSKAVILYQKGSPVTEICHICNISMPSLYRYLDIMEIPLDRGSNPHLDFFHSIDTEFKAYWLGFIAADGHVCPDRNQLKIGLCRTDYVHLCRLRDALGVRNRIYWTRPKTRGKIHNVSTLDVRSKGMVADLIALGLKRNKTHNLEWPPIPPVFERHFIRGYFDGDGCWTIKKGQWRPNLEFACIGTWSFIGSLQDNLVANCQLQHTKLKKHQSTPSVCIAVYGGNLQCIRIANYLYEDATIYLPRKRNVVLNHYRQFPEYYSQLRFPEEVA